jgi:hypothetical protein
MSKFKKLGAIAKNLGLAGAGGYVGARLASSAHEAKDNARSGLKTGLAVGAVASTLPPLSKIVFRRIRGRIIPIKVK